MMRPFESGPTASSAGYVVADARPAAIDSSLLPQNMTRPVLTQAPPCSVGAIVQVEAPAAPRGAGTARILEAMRPTC